ncbi:Trehalose transport system permease protein SugA [Candidatus Thermoflexus japonica]|uniref:Trehalose transport system permease protein SugA n=1 Tax=Candidatus Thermoflexus japonica TaxID=2035417 RepID=A0A2H5Y4Y5_9CHLR|nr:Trehalose transport system permease protein SugA [Candidatus Thermoflexus japonica]
MGHRDRRLGRRMVLPLILLLLAVQGYPMAFAVYISAHDYRLTALSEIRWVGLEQYRGLLGNSSYWTAMKNTLVFVFGAVGLELLLGFLLAYLLWRPVPAQNLFRAILLTPMFVTPIAVGLMFRFLLNNQLGIIPVWLRSLGLEIDWFGPDLALFSLILIDVWQWTPLMVLLLLAGLEALPVEPFEAARVDGASELQIIRHLTIPLIRPVMLAAILIRMLDAFRVFEYVYAITRGGPGERTETILFHIYRVGFLYFRLGEAAAMAITLALVIFVLVVLLFRILRRQEALT